MANTDGNIVFWLKVPCELCLFHGKSDRGLDNLQATDLYSIDQANPDLRGIVTQRLDQQYGGYMNMSSVNQIPGGAQPFGVSPPFSNGQSFASIYPRLDLQNSAEEDQPVYVNAKQYNRIILRRKARAKWEAEHRVTKRDRKYMHESRHNHALRRLRGSDGRFLKKEEQEAILNASKMKQMEPSRAEMAYRHPDIPQPAAVYQPIATMPLDPRITVVAAADVVPKPVLNGKPMGLDETKEDETTYPYFAADGQESAL